MTRAREVWRHLVEQYVVSNAVRPRLERPISLYSSLELEALLLRWMSAHRALNAKTFQTAREREFKITDAHRVHLGAGGRWLFVASSKAGITYYDLDSDSSESPSGVELIPNQIAHTCPSWVQVTIEDDMQSPFVGFSVAFALSSHEYSTGATENWHHFQIWRVEAVLDGMQRVIGLKATQIASFPHIHRIAPHCSISLRGPHLAFHVMAAREYYVCVVDWRQANSLPSKYPFRVAQRASFPSVSLIYHSVSIMSANPFFI
ncbi:hypothetical protein JR316_0005800 [Psilocybe cubensis]|uniref:Uncharacterized protein n=1 Tax=Psilocybe cubensis TaxID=181762 RepID=A0ACB8GZV0_PSICU|nr:hypothetical protein JR316_0005800 [Psilocybe cubensis]KAH9481278.1 hypothetical protein JR316_0005800 [Psilocybe cubensis]